MSDHADLELVMTMLFVCAFEFAPGPVVWLYMGEIMNEKGLSAGALANWTFTLVIGLITPTLMSPEGFGPARTFWLFGFFNILAVAFIMVFMKETRGLSDE